MTVESQAKQRYWIAQKCSPARSFCTTRSGAQLQEDIALRPENVEDRATQNFVRDSAKGARFAHESQTCCCFGRCSGSRGACFWGWPHCAERAESSIRLADLWRE